MIKAIETSYAGCRFRSRLEARWAVFFDALGIEWQYEAEGYVLGDGSYYLPDFWLPGFNLWAEVKGAEPGRRERELIRQASMSSGLPTASHGHLNPYRLLVLSDIPKHDETHISHVVTKYLTEYPEHVSLSFAGFYVYKGHCSLQSEGIWPEWTGWAKSADFLDLSRDVVHDLDFYAHPLTEPVHHGGGHLCPVVRNAYDAARSARFEHGQEGGFKARSR